MTFRERLADWISGGAVTWWREVVEFNKEVTDNVRNQRDDALRQVADYGIALDAIYDATANGKSGTAQKIHRMAKEALGE